MGMRIYPELKVGDVIIFRHDDKLLVQRIAAVGGEIVEKDGSILTVPDGCYYLLGIMPSIPLTRATGRTLL